jgi:stage V sporulation protein AC
MGSHPEDRKQNYEQYVKRKMPPSPIFFHCLKAFLAGGAICSIGQGFNQLGQQVLHLSADDTAAFTAAVMIFIGATLTGIGLYDVIGKFAGAGSIVPITGFANSIVAPAMEFKREGFVTGVGARLFTIAGPVLVYGISTSILIGLIYIFVPG